MKPLLLFLSAVLSAQHSLDAPTLAHVLDADGQLTPILGLAGNFVPGRPGPALLAYSNDGDIEWRLEPGRLSATRDGRTAWFATPATRAFFRGAFAIFPDTNEILRLDGDLFVNSSDKPNLQLAGRAITWHDGKLRIFQPDGTEEEIACPQEPESITAAAAGWAHLIVNRRSHLLRLTSGRAQLYVLPQRRRE
ncbi:MAG: hypothetical protein ACKV2U_15400 [Bryobacteraceae bacterium]